MIAVLPWLKAIPWPWVGPVLVALITSWLCLMTRWRHKGRPFANRATTVRALATIVWTGLVATVAMVVTVRLAPAVPFTVGLALPAYMLLPASALKRLAVPDSSLAESPVYKIASLGATLFLDGLKQKIGMARACWCNERVDETWTVYDIQRAADRVVRQLEGRDDGLTVEVGSDYDAVDQEVRRYETSTTDRERNKHCSYAGTALKKMLERAWNWGYTDISMTGLSSSPGGRPSQAAGSGG